MKRQNRRNNQKADMSEQERILHTLHHIQIQLISAQSGFANETDEALIDSYIYEIYALHKQYEYWLRRAKELAVDGRAKIS